MTKTISAVIATALTAAMSFSADALSGSWRGTLNAGRAELPIVLTFGTDSVGKPTCSFMSPMQSKESLPMTVDHCTDDSLVVRYPKLGIIYRASVSPERISGRFRQFLRGFDLTLTPEIPLSARRPQAPVAPFPYTTVDTTFTSADGTLLSGTVTLPARLSKNIPLVVMVSGSGPQNRDEEVFEHRPFAVIADWLARNGVASLRYDDRGTAGSQGDFASSTTYTFRDDARSAVEFARTLPAIGRVGILGHSEGGTIALMLAADGVPDFIISLAGMAVRAKETLIAQNRHRAEQTGLDESTREAMCKLLSIIFDEMAAQYSRGIVEGIDVNAIIAANSIEIPDNLAAEIAQSVKQRTSWFDCFLTIDPDSFLGRISCPVLALNGEKDTQVNCDSNLSAIRNSVPQAKIISMPGLNHLFQHADTGDSSEYGSISETISPEVLDIILEFCRR